MSPAEFNEKRAFYFRLLAEVINRAHRDCQSTQAFTLMVLVDVVSVIGSGWITNESGQDILPKAERLAAANQMLERMRLFWQAEHDGTTEQQIAAGIVPTPFAHNIELKPGEKVH